MMTVEELHAHYRAVRARITDKSKAKEEPKPVKELKAEKTEERVIVPFVLPTFVNPSDMIMWTVAKEHGFSVADIKGPSRKHKLVLARQEIAYRLRTERNLSLNQVAMMIGGRDHTTALHAIKAHAKRLAERTDTLGEHSHLPLISEAG